MHCLAHAAGRAPTGGPACGAAARPYGGSGAAPRWMAHRPGACMRASAGALARTSGGLEEGPPAARDACDAGWRLSAGPGDCGEGPTCAQRRGVRPCARHLSRSEEFGRRRWASRYFTGEDASRVVHYAAQASTRCTPWPLPNTCFPVRPTPLRQGQCSSVPQHQQAYIHTRPGAGLSVQSDDNLPSAHALSSGTPVPKCSRAAPARKSRLHSKGRGRSNAVGAHTDDGGGRAGAAAALDERAETTKIVQVDSNV
eukprot:scaffold3505_cov385-Prasinococcus_capsulatus_cf.AAC.13